MSVVQFHPWPPIKATPIAESSKTDLQAPDDAYLLCSVCGDLVTSEMVNAPVNVVSLYFPRYALARALRARPFE